ncbi:uncharacterized protein N7469_001951 [Penicillium citrinum]|uniref:Allergen Asp f 7 n=1 Tax=Penicillium citrinum TaxID=5077 RepID=A0A9W9P9R9_PENCI|nr:uncharacterized protein N7469_001951 [Penicillium citrinum]KAJ5240360.1 hypothetical protein N7469_001951 [Penicillium citrinum]
MLSKAKIWAVFIGAAYAAPFCSDMLSTKTETAWIAAEVHTTLTLTRLPVSTSSTISRVPTRTHSEVLSPYVSVLDSTACPQTPSPTPLENDARLNKESQGDLTFFVTTTDPSSPSACGTTNNGETELVLALPQSIMDPSDCGKDVTIEYKGISKVGRVVDKCNGCDEQSIDLSIALFRQFSDLKSGRLFGATWSIVH